MRATVVRTWDSEDFIIPNSVLVSSTVKNFTLGDRLHRIRTLVGVTYDSDMKKVREVLEETTRSLPWREASTDPVILTNLNEAVWFALKDAGITIAFPQLDVHLDDPTLDAIRGSDESG
jgi:small-conductance mechanosensitive channel